MQKLKNKIRNTKGFTIIETLIGLMILTTAIVSATSMLLGLMQSNKQIVKTLQAHYLAQEGLEAVRNIRDTNWMHNLDWKKGDVKFLGGFEVKDDGGVNQYEVGLNLGFAGVGTTLETLSKPWNLKSVGNGDSSKIYLCGGKYFLNNCSDPGSAVDSGFTRIIEISKPVYCSGDGADSELCENAMLVKSIVKFDKNKEVSLEEILTNWKGGAL
jgi:type II secretory pathway pseudopilin PulG